MARGVDAKSMYSFNAIGNRRRQKGKNPSLKAREGWKWKAEPSRFVYHRYEFFSLRPSFFFPLSTRHFNLAETARKIYFSTSRNEWNSERKKSTKVTRDLLRASVLLVKDIIVSGSLTFHHRRTGSFVRKRGILISFHLRSSFIPSDF